MHKLSSLACALPLSAALFLTGCGSNISGSSQASPETPIAQSTNPSNSSSDSNNGADNAASQSDEQSGPKPTLANQDQGGGQNQSGHQPQAVNPGVGAQGASIGGNYYPNGDALGTSSCYDFPANLDVNVSDAISCAFAAEMYKAAISVPYVTGPSNGNVTSVPKAHITVASPTTGQNYAVKCYFGTDQRGLTCQTEGSSSQTARVYFSADSAMYWQQRVSIN